MTVGSISLKMANSVLSVVIAFHAFGVVKNQCGLDAMLLNCYNVVVLHLTNNQTHKASIIWYNSPKEQGGYANATIQRNANQRGA